MTCTLGELGEVIPADLAYLAADAGGGLGEYRIGELRAACAALGVTDHRFLGGPGRWRDSGMMGTPGNDAPGCFWQADVGGGRRRAAAASSARCGPQVMVSYDERGFYGHPDHIQAHRVARRAFDWLAGGRQVLRDGPAAVGAAAGRSRWTGRRGPGGGSRQVESIADLPFGVPDEAVTTQVDAGDYLDAKLAAMRAHATQISVDAPFYALSDGIGMRALGTEYYTLLAGPPTRPACPAGRGRRAAARRAGERPGVRPVRRDWLACVRGLRSRQDERHQPPPRHAGWGTGWIRIGAYVALLLLGVG